MKKKTAALHKRERLEKSAWVLFKFQWWRRIGGGRRPIRIPDHIGTEELKVDTITTSVTLPDMMHNKDYLKRVIMRELAVRFGSAIVEHNAFRLISVRPAFNGIDMEYNYEIRLVRYPEEDGGGVVMP